MTEGAFSEHRFTSGIKICERIREIFKLRVKNFGVFERKSRINSKERRRAYEHAKR